MAFIILYPAVAAVALFVIGVIIVLLRFGPRLLGVRHEALHSGVRHAPHWRENVYEHEISYA